VLSKIRKIEYELLATCPEPLASATPGVPSARLANAIMDRPSAVAAGLRFLII
jgi:hypothetical protein